MALSSSKRNNLLYTMIGAGDQRYLINFDIELLLPLKFIVFFCKEIQQRPARWEADEIEIVGTNISTPTAHSTTNSSFGSSNGARRGGQGRGGGFGKQRGGGGCRGFGRGRARGRGRGEKVSVEDLDVDLEKYHSESMQTN